MSASGPSPARLLLRRVVHVRPSFSPSLSPVTPALIVLSLFFPLLSFLLGQDWDTPGESLHRIALSTLSF